MVAFIAVSGLGIVVCMLGIINMTGNVSSVHWYHRARVAKEDIKPFGRLVGIGTIIIGLGMIAFGALFFAFEKTGLEALVIIGVAVLLISIAVGVATSFYAMKRYNGGIF